MVIARPPAWAIVRCWPFSTAEASANCTVPKSSSGMVRRPAAGASSTHSAEECDEAYVSVAWYVCPVVRFRKAISQLPSGCSAMETLTVSPGPTASGTGREAWGSVSTQAV